MKPDWKDAPEWANWLAMDDNGEWFWFEFEPYNDDGIYRVTRGEYDYAGESDLVSTKEPRPK